MNTKDKIIAAIKEQMEETKGNLGLSKRSKSDLVLGFELALSIVKNAFKEEEKHKQKVEEAMAEAEMKAKAFTEAHQGETSEEMLRVCRGEFLDNIDWVERRYEIAKTILPYCAGYTRKYSSITRTSYEEDAAISAVDYADALIKMLKTTEP